MHFKGNYLSFRVRKRTIKREFFYLCFLQVVSGFLSFSCSIWLLELCCCRSLSCSVSVIAFVTRWAAAKITTAQILHYSYPKGKPATISILSNSLFKGEVSRKFAAISKPKNVCLSAETMK